MLQFSTSDRRECKMFDLKIGVLKVWAQEKRVWKQWMQENSFQ